MSTKSLMAEVLFPNKTEDGDSKIGAVILGADKVTANQYRKLEKLLPSFADMRYRLGMLKIEVSVPSQLQGRAAMHKLAKTIRSIILRGLGVKAGLCPVTSSDKILGLLRCD